MQRFLFGISALFLSVALRAENLVPSDHWQQLVGDHLFDIRAIVPPHHPCPLVDLGQGELAVMSVRARPSRLFPVTVCSYRYSDSISPHLIGINPVSDELTHLIVMAQTGCVFSSSFVCSDQPSRDGLLSEIARHRPQLIVHLGGMLGTDQRGRWLPDRWSSWRHSWFEPARILQRSGTQPVFLFVRGPEASCHADWRGWARFFAPNTIPKRCAHWQATWYAHWDHFYSVVVDGSLSRSQDLDETKDIIDRWQLDTLYHRPWIMTTPALWGYTVDHQRQQLIPVSSHYAQALGSWAVHNSSMVWGTDSMITAVTAYAGLPVQMTVGGDCMVAEPLLMPTVHPRLSHWYWDPRRAFFEVWHGQEEAMNRFWHVRWYTWGRDVWYGQWEAQSLADVSFQARQFEWLGTVHDVMAPRVSFSQ